MYFAIAKFSFDPLEDPSPKDLKSLSQKIQSKFKVDCRHATAAGAGAAYIAVAALEHRENDLTKKLDEISDYCEEFGIGRMNDEMALMDHLDNLEDYNS